MTSSVLISYARLWQKHYEIPKMIPITRENDACHNRSHNIVESSPTLPRHSLQRLRGISCPNGMAAISQFLNGPCYMTSGLPPPLPYPPIWSPQQPSANPKLLFVRVSCFPRRLFRLSFHGHLFSESTFTLWFPIHFPTRESVRVLSANSHGLKKKKKWMVAHKYWKSWKRKKGILKSWIYSH